MTLPFHSGRILRRVSRLQRAAMAFCSDALAGRSFGRSAAFLFGVRADFILLAAGVTLAVDLIRPRHARKVRAVSPWPSHAG